MVVRLTAEDAIHVFGDDDVEQLRFGRTHQRLKARPVGRGRSGNLSVFKGRDDLHPRAVAKIAAKNDLIFD
nr:hypothetical protein [Bradyrhizobium elkanii]